MNADTRLWNLVISDSCRAALARTPGTVKTLARGVLTNLRRLRPNPDAALALQGGDPR